VVAGFQVIIDGWFWVITEEGIKDVLFPAGTYWLRRFATAVCEPWPAASA
jgi:hypothetical protein